MSFNFVNNFWFKSFILIFSVLLLSTWALRPISKDELVQHQQENLVNLAESVNGILSQSFEDLNFKIRYILSDMENKKEVKNLDSYATPIKALFALDDKDNNLHISKPELRSLDLSYWERDDLNKSINRIFASEDNSYDLGLQIISSPSGDNYYGYLFLEEGRYYLAILSLRFAVEWGEHLKYKNTDVIVMNALGELIYHPEFQYIGTEYNQADKIFNQMDIKTQQAKLQSKNSVSFARAVGMNDVSLVLVSKKWSSLYGTSFYGKFFLVFLALGLLLYTFSQYLRDVSQQETLLLNQQALGQHTWTSMESKGLLEKVKHLEKQLAKKSESSQSLEQGKVFYDLKSKSANLIGQIQLLKGEPENTQELIQSLEAKARKIYKQIFQLIDEPQLQDAMPSAKSQVMPEIPSEPIPETNKGRSIDYSFDDSKLPLAFVGEEERIEITEEDIGGVELSELPGLEGINEIKSVSKTTKLTGDALVEQNIKQQLEEQNYTTKKAFNIEDIYLSEQAEQAQKIQKKIPSGESFEDQMSRVDKIIENADQNINTSTREIRNIVRKPRLKDLT